jgi:ribosomal-protein-alanine acetyltransferase
MDILVDDASLNDLGEMFEIEKECFTVEAFSRQQISYLLKDFNSISLVAKIDGKIAGFVILQLDSVGSVVFGHIITLNVAVKFRRMGVAQRLLLECEDVLRSRGVVECHLEVRQDNAAAIGLYKRLGYEEIGLLEGYYGKKHGLYLKKNL